MTSLALYQLSEQYQSVIERIVQAGGELTPELERALTDIADEWREKAIRVALVIREAEALAEAAQAEARRLQELARTRANLATNLKRYLLHEMLQTRELRIDSPLVRLAVVQNSRPTIRWELPLDQLPAPYVRTRIELDGEAAYRAWKAGEQLPPGFVVEHGFHLRIR
ncbi:MAG: hypothetical protein KatS3mg109_0390 [Pirellulaceae bacterium]|nr:MAG: hypothetical protein KatS3mg109_0390 [Pirellulaceae bacterium]